MRLNVVVLLLVVIVLVIVLIRHLLPPIALKMSNSEIAKNSPVTLL